MFSETSSTTRAGFFRTERHRLVGLPVGRLQRNRRRGGGVSGAERSPFDRDEGGTACVVVRPSTPRTIDAGGFRASVTSRVRTPRGPSNALRRFRSGARDAPRFALPRRVATTSASRPYDARGVRKRPISNRHAGERKARSPRNFSKEFCARYALSDSDRSREEFSVITREQFSSESRHAVNFFSIHVDRHQQIL